LLFIILGLFLILTFITGFYIFREVKNYQPDNSQNNKNPKNEIIYHLKQQKKYPRPEGKNNLNFYLGTTSPLVTIVEFSSFGCPESKNSYSKIRKLGLKYEDEIKIIFRHFPTSENSLNFSLASYCAGEQGAFWPMHDKLFQNQKKINSSQQITTFAEQIGIDTKLFQKCLSSNKYEDEITTDIKEGKEMGVSGTPTWFFNGYRIKGDIPYNIMEAITVSLIKENKG